MLNNHGNILIYTTLSAGFLTGSLFIGHWGITHFNFQHKKNVQVLSSDQIQPGCSFYVGMEPLNIMNIK